MVLLFLEENLLCFGTISLRTYLARDSTTRSYKPVYLRKNKRWFQTYNLSNASRNFMYEPNSLKTCSWFSLNHHLLLLYELKVLLGKKWIIKKVKLVWACLHFIDYWFTNSTQPSVCRCHVICSTSAWIHANPSVWCSAGDF